MLNKHALLFPLDKHNLHRVLEAQVKVVMCWIPLGFMSDRVNSSISTSIWGGALQGQATASIDRSPLEPKFWVGCKLGTMWASGWRHPLASGLLAWGAWGAQRGCQWCSSNI